VTQDVLPAEAALGQALFKTKIFMNPMKIEFADLHPSQNETGFSLVEVMLALGALGVLGYGLMVSTGNSIKGQNRVKVNSDIDSYVALVSSKIANPATCLQIFGNAVTLNATAQATTASQGLAALPPLPTSISNVSVAIQNSLIGPATAGSTSWPAQMILTFTRNPINGGNSLPVTRNIPFMATTAAYVLGVNPVAITGCAASDAILTPAQICSIGQGTWNAGVCVAPGANTDTGATNYTITTVRTYNITRNYTVAAASGAPLMSFPAPAPTTTTYLCMCVDSTYNNQTGYIGRLLSGFSSLPAGCTPADGIGNNTGTKTDETFIVCTNTRPNGWTAPGNPYSFINPQNSCSWTCVNIPPAMLSGP